MKMIIKTLQRASLEYFLNLNFFKTKMNPLLIPLQIQSDIIKNNYNKGQPDPKIVSHPFSEGE